MSSDSAANGLQRFEAVPLPKPWFAPPDARVIESGQAWVYQVMKRGCDERFALKRLKNPSRAARFMREIEAMQELRLRGIDVVPPVIAHEVGHDRRAFYVMPWYEDGSLEQAVSEQRFRTVPVEGLRILLQVADAVRVLHESGWAHRDLKPANVLLDGEQVVLCDLGLALDVNLRGAERVTTPLRQSDLDFISPPKMSPGWASL